MNAREARYERKTAETAVEVSLRLDGVGRCEASTGIGFLDHLLSALARHGRMDMTISCSGDIDIDDHHTAEDCAIGLGNAMDRALGERQDFARFGSAYAPLDEALARAVVDFSGRPVAWVTLNLSRDSIGGLACENIEHVLSSFAMAARITLHVDVIKGSNDHHKAEAAFKAVALALRQAITRQPNAGIPSTKEAL